MDDSISDAAIAEMEADIYGLQVRIAIFLDLCVSLYCCPYLPWVLVSLFTMPGQLGFFFFFSSFL